MEQLVMAIAIPLAKQYGMNKALEIAYERLGIAAPKQSTIDILTGGGINQAFGPSNISNMFKRGALRLGANTLMKGAGSSLLPFAGILGLATLGNKYRKQLTGYDTQSAYEAAKTKRIANKRLDRITDRMTSGKNYGNYEEALLDSGAGAVKIDDKITYATDYFPDNNNNDSDSGSTGSKSSSKGKSDRPGGSASFGQSFHGARGGIVSL
jgi:hypothetical protein|tara:strand:- start:588 stop:1217 length:630 start_codon:yes stop_codon:yes gene_type:complete